jgi:hypothetical protein
MLMTVEQSDLVRRNLPGSRLAWSDGDFAEVEIPTKIAPSHRNRRGLGDWIAAALKRLGFRQGSCGCARRQEAINRWWFKLFR